jgi:hypothetical protein
MEFAANYADETGSWVVIVCPQDSDIQDNCQKAFMGTVRPNSTLSGRTAVFPNGGRLSLTACDEEVFIPDDHSFSVSFIGWSYPQGKKVTAYKNQMEHMGKWREAASRVLNLWEAV